MRQGDSIVYHINNADAIIYVNEQWDTFALFNEGAEVSSSKVLGKSLWEFITDSTVRTIYRDVLAKIRSGNSIDFEFRCDAPAFRRYLSMHIAMLNPSVVAFTTRTLLIEVRPPVSFLDSRAASATDTFVCSCSWCKKIRIDNVWVELETALRELELLKHPATPKITHGICDDCHKAMSDAIRRST